MDPAGALSMRGKAADKFCPKDSRDLIDFTTLWTLWTYRFLLASCPQAASMSLPLLRRTLTTMFLLSRKRTN